jgi:D-amino-acid dehydrogenase
MVLLRSEADRALIDTSLAVLRDAGVAFAKLGPDAARKLEPGLNPGTDFHAAIHLPQDEVGNCRQFALLLKNECQRRGVAFEFGTTVSRVETGKGIRLHLQGAGPGDGTAQNFDAAVACAGLGSAQLLKPLGLKLPMAAVYGYSVSAPVREALNAPRSSVMDERYKVAISRLGNRVRVAGSAELGGNPAQHRAASIRTLYKVLHDWFPGGVTLSSGVQVWKGARPMLPDGPPVIAASSHPGLWLNLGHGSSGWALSCGSARALADLVAGKSPDVDVGNFGLGRLA